MRVRAGSPQPLPWLLAAVSLGVIATLLPLLVNGSPLWLLAILITGMAVLILILGWPFSGIAILIIAALLTRYRFELGPVSVRIEHLAVLGVGAIGVLQLLVTRGRLRMPLSAWLALGWWGMNLISGLFFSPDPAVGLQHSLRLALVVATFILVLNLIPNRQHWWLAVTLFLVAGVLEAAFGIMARALYPFGINLGVQVSWNFTEPIPYGTFEEGNLFGSHIAAWATVLLMLIFSADIWRRPPSPQQIIRFLGLGILLIALYLSLSRASYLALLLGGGLTWVLYRRQNWHQINRFLLVVIASPFLLALILSIVPFLPPTIPFVDRLQSFLTLSSDATFSARLSDWGLAWQDWIQRPWTGWGPGSFYMIHGELRGNPAWISNLSLRLLQETGMGGVLFFGGYVLALILPAIRVSMRLPRASDRAALLGLAIAYLVLLGFTYQSTDGIWLAASWVHAGLIAAGTQVLPPTCPPDNTSTKAS